MKISVLIPVYNGSLTIRATVESVLRQTRPADEILILDDGSTDDTAAGLKPYVPRINILRQANRGVAASRNALCQAATGDLISFVDADDLWHCRYLETVERLFQEYPNSVAIFTGHVNFEGYGDYEWKADPFSTPAAIETLSGREFLKRYNESTGQFASPSYFSLPARILRELGNEPFRFSGVEDSYLCTRLPLLGSVVRTSMSLVAYRITNESLSADRLKMFGPWVDVFRHLEERYDDKRAQHLRSEFRLAFSSRRRQYGKLLMTAGRILEAREQFRLSLGTSLIPSSMAKSAGWFLATYLPERLQPAWPPLLREWKPSSQHESPGTTGTEQQMALDDRTP